MGWVVRSGGLREQAVIVDWPMLVTSALMGTWGGYTTLAFKAGRLRRSARWYFDRTQPAYVRNLPFIALPASLFFGAGALIIGLHQMEDAWADAVVAVAGLAAFTALVLALIWAHRPPEFLKPDWLRAEERPRSS